MGKKMSKLEFRDKIFDQYDTNKNNVIDKGEIKLFLKDILKELENKELSSEVLNQTFKELDKNKNKELSRWEVTEILDQIWEKRYGKK